MRKQITSEEFIKLSNIKFNNLYDYSLVKYKNKKTKVKIICKEHDVFEKTPHRHLNGAGCPKCLGLYKTTDDIIKEFKNKHNDKYDYSLVNYVKSDNVVKIICKEHGVFEQAPNSHLSGHGCKKCGDKELSIKFSSNTNTFIEKANKIHNYKYDYSLVKYINTKNEVKIICKEHGTFDQLPSSHLSGRGCKLCGIDKIWQNRKITNNMFIEKSNKIHNGEYDYSKVIYDKAIKNVNIICKKHEIFEQTPNSHLNGRGCPKCYGTFLSNTLEFIEKSNIVHNNKYDYSFVNYVNCKTCVKIICKEHGPFVQQSLLHLSGSGCPECGIISSHKKQTISQHKFIEKSNIVHNNKYDYSLVEYVNCKVKVKIICKEHGSFDQSPDHHSRGVGCPICSNFYGNFNDKFLYIFYDNKYNLMKIGISENPEKRLKMIEKGKEKGNIEILKIYEKKAILENKLHIKYAEFRTKHTLYEDGNTEWFNLNKNELCVIDDYIKSYK